MNGFRGIALALICLATHRDAWGDEYRLKLVPHPNPKEGISNLKWDEDRDTQEPVLQIRELENSSKQATEKEKAKEDVPYFVKLQGKFQQKDRSLLYQNRPVAVGSEGKFTIEVGIDSEHPEFVINEIDEAGNITTQKSELLFPEWEQFKSTQKEPAQKKWSVSPGLGFTLATYQQTGIASFTQTALTLKVAAEYTLSGPWDIGGSAYYTALPLTTTQSGMTLQFLGLNLRAGFRVLKPEQTWGLSIMGGIYYATTFASGTFGYHNVQGPQIYPVLRRKFSGNKSAWLYFKYSPIFNGRSFVSLTNAEFAIGGGYTFKSFSNGGVLAATVDVALLSLQVSSSVTVQSNTYSLGASYRF